MKLSTSKFERSATARFVPSDVDRSAMRLSWVNANEAARVEVESGSFFAREYSDRHGYPAS